MKIFDSTKIIHSNWIPADSTGQMVLMGARLRKDEIIEMSRVFTQVSAEVFEVDSRYYVEKCA